MATAIGAAQGRTPALADAKAAEAWLANAALVDPRQACHELTGLLERLEDAPPAERAYLDVLEKLREPIQVAQAEHAKKFTGRPLPLRDVESAAFDQVFDLWSAFGRAYRRLLGAAVDGRDAELLPQAALLAQRTIEARAAVINAHYRCRREVDGDLWRELHDAYQIAESYGLARTSVPTKRKPATSASPAQVYVRTLLLDIANPYAISARDFQWLRRWAGLWAHKVELGLALDAAQGYAVDLAGAAPPAWTRLESATPTTRFLDTSQLKRSIKGRLRKLEQGAEPEALGLGKDAVQPDAGRLLAQAARAWLEAPAARQFTRRLAPGRTELVSGFDSLHVALTGRVFKSAARHWDYSRRDAESLAIYGAVAGAGADGPRLATEAWETLDESANGFRLRRKGAGERLSHHQLVGLKPQGARTFILSEVRWLTVGVDGALVIGAQALPGLAQGVAVRPAWGGTGTPEPYVQAFVLPAMPGSSPSLVLPTGWYQQGRDLEVKTDEDLMAVRLGALLQHGFDFDRVAFAPRAG
ncbi:MAG: hypothetical protein N2544_12080 [Burkholderiales bacterium]|nr:hypothetical protein [Burkholderiales bacterium]